eukprot:1166844-Pyramimonas_sp.AAC.1
MFVPTGPPSGSPPGRGCQPLAASLDLVPGLRPFPVPPTSPGGLGGPHPLGGPVVSVPTCPPSGSPLTGRAARFTSPWIAGVIALSAAPPWIPLPRWRCSSPLAWPVTCSALVSAL